MENYRAEETNCETSLKTNRIKRKKKKNRRKMAEGGSECSVWEKEKF